MTAPITPDERAAMRERYPRVERPSDPYDEDAWNRYWDDPSPDVLRLLDALDTAEGKTDRQRDHLRAREEQVRRLRAEVTRLHALVADLRAARPAPVWDEGVALREAVRLYPTEHVGYDRPAPSDCQCDECYRREAQRDAYVAGRLAVVREHAPVRPDRESVWQAWHGTDEPWGGCADAEGVGRVLDLWPGESRATVQAEALRDAAERLGPWTLASEVRQQLLDDADRLDPKGK